MNYSPQKKRLAFTLCAIATLAVHGGGIFYFYQHPLVLQSTWTKIFQRSPEKTQPLEVDETLFAAERNQALREVFEIFEQPAGIMTKPYDLEYNLASNALRPSQETAATHIELPILKDEDPFDQAFDTQALYSRPSLIFPEEDAEPLGMEEDTLLFKPHLEIDKTVALSVPLPSFEAEPEFLQDYDRDSGSYTISQEAHPSQEAATAPFMQDLNPLLQKKRHGELVLKINPVQPIKGLPAKDFHYEAAPSHEPLVLAKPPRDGDHKKAHRSLAAAFKPLPQFDQYRFPEKEKSLDWDEGDFEVSVHLMPNTNEDGYIFSVNLVPNLDLPSEKLKHCFHFLIDRSNSIEKHRYAVFKKAVLKAIGYLQAGDQFNITIFDKKCVRMSERDMPFTASTKRMAEEFLEAQEYKGHFSAGDLYSSLDKILSATVRDNELHTAILITDGNSLLDGKKQQKAINQWMQRNNGKVNLYTAAVGKDNNLIMLDLLSSCNRGKLLYSETHASFPRKLAKLVLSLREPLAKDLALTVIPNDPHANIKFFPADAKLPALFKKRPMTLLGTIDRLCNFNIYLQGKQKKSPLNIKIPVSFEEARKGSKNLEKLWALYEVNTYYDKFLKEGRSAHLKKAKQLLKDAGGEIAFE